MLGRAVVVIDESQVAGLRRARRILVARQRSLAVACVVGEPHLHLERLARVRRYQRVGAAVRADIRLVVRGVHPHPLEVVAGRECVRGQTVRVINRPDRGRQRLAHLRHARDHLRRLAGPY